MPSGAVAGTLLVQRGSRVLILEREQFARFSIGVSLLPQCREFLEEAGTLDAIRAEGFQRKEGALFQWQWRSSGFDFSEQFAEGCGETFEVQCSRFEDIPAWQVERQGVEIRYRYEILAVDLDGDVACVVCRNESLEADGETVTANGGRKVAEPGRHAAATSSGELESRPQRDRRGRSA